jgi:ABC-type glycerol-3-phosphate transport system substrate-binding protein
MIWARKALALLSPRSPYDGKGGVTMFSSRESLMKSMVFAILIGLMLVACGPAVPEVVEVPEEEEAEVPEEEEVEVPEEEEVTAIPVPPGTVRFWVPDFGDRGEVMQAQVAGFMEQYPDVEVELVVTSYYDFDDMLVSSLMAGVPPDVATVPYNLVSEMQAWDFLAALDEQIERTDLSDFVHDSLDSGNFNGTYYGLPWGRAACSPTYRYLVLFERSENPEAAFALMHFLVQPEQQIQNYTELQWFPTQESVYWEMGIECPLFEAIRLAPEAVAQTVSLVTDLRPVLELVLEGQAINPYEATTVIENGETQGTAAPVITSFSTEAFNEALLEGVVIGALSVDQAPEFPPGDYAVKCQDYEGARCYLVSPEGGERIEIDLEVFEETQGLVLQSACIVERGSKKLCFRLDSRKICFRVG